MSHLAKYRNRPSPSFPANDPACRGTTKRGNDGLMYTSVPDKNGVFKWKYILAASPKRSPTRQRSTNRSRSPARTPRNRSPARQTQNRRKTAPRNIFYESPIELIGDDSFMTMNRRPGGKWKRLRYANLPDIGSKRINLKFKASDGGGSMYSFGHRLNQSNVYVRKGDEDFEWGYEPGPVLWRFR